MSSLDDTGPSSGDGSSAADIITYIGVPLAVLGVMPILYNTGRTLITLSNVKRLLRKSRLAGITRGDVVNHVIEVELPRFSIAPVHREHQADEYWHIYEHPSLVPGGSWTIFNWKMHTVGIRTQRIEYSDQVCGFLWERLSYCHPIEMHLSCQLHPSMTLMAIFPWR